MEIVKDAEVTPTELLVQLGKASYGETSNVPCGTCNACCWYARTDVDLAKERPEDVEHLQMEHDEQGYYLAHRADGGCIHLGEAGCEVWAYRPEVCRTYDCRAFGLGGLAPQTTPTQIAPGWRFPLRTPLDRAIVLAAQTAAAPYVEAYTNGTPPPSGNQLGNLLRGIYEMLPFARKAVEQFKEE